MKFSQHMKKIIAEDRELTGIIINDKIRVKEYVDERLGNNELFSHRLYAGYDIDEAIKKAVPPCVIRLNNGWHKMKFVFSEKDKIDRTQFLKWQQSKYPSAEWSYKQIKSGFTVEKLLPKKHSLYKFFVFHGKVRYIWVQQYSIESGKIDLQSATMHDREFNQLNVQWNNAKIKKCEKPSRLKDMITISELLFYPAWKFMRIDLYCIKDRILLSEINNYHAGGSNGFSDDFDEILGQVYEER